MAENPLRTVTPTQLPPRAGDRGGRGEGHRRALGHGRPGDDRRGLAAPPAIASGLGDRAVLG